MGLISEKLIGLILEIFVYVLRTMYMYLKYLYIYYVH
jgi:hypothetical protein